MPVNRMIDAALDAVNQHARSLGVSTFDIVPVDGGERVRIVPSRVAAVATGVRQDYDGPTADEVAETHAAGQREREWESQTAAPRQLAEKLARLRA